MNIGETLNNFGFDWRMALANLVNFLIIFWLLRKFAFKPIKKILDERQKNISKGIQDSEKAAGEVKKAQENYDQKTSEAKKEANVIITNATEQGRELVNQASKEAQGRAEKIITDAKVIITKEKEKIKEEIKKETAEIALTMAEKVIKEKLDKEKDSEMIKKLVR